MRNKGVLIAQQFDRIFIEHNAFDYISLIEVRLKPSGNLGILAYHSDSPGSIGSPVDLRNDWRITVTEFDLDRFSFLSQKFAGIGAGVEDSHFIISRS
ncbi:hypothetical protein AGR4A_Lc10014 [Agrobacterium tumefaciens str. B6]|uniref:Uncharacterized protein n=1 Tax=Agrobacterium tumefaciens str. B6 TaxID=1183423 RepID=A0A822V007_AGRTU|nr:hypothetical protein AGR4A_Lc10014 [Agrobacterium tumefaciens str. B6]